MAGLRLLHGDKVSGRLRLIQSNIKRQSPHIIQKTLYKVERETFPKVPRRKGLLERSAKIKIDSSAGPVYSGSISYIAMSRGFNYATVQHERTDFKHPIKGRAKFLESTLEDYTKFINSIGDEIRRTLR